MNVRLRKKRTLFNLSLKEVNHERAYSIYSGSCKHNGICRECHIALSKQPKWEEECGSCHVAYPPQLLTQNDWEGLMEGLDKHFDDNAVLDLKDNKEILDFLQRYAGNNNEHTAPSLRIRDTPWFTLKHRPIFSTLVTRYFTGWSNSAEKTPAIMSRASCPTCHVRVERGD